MRLLLMFIAIAFAAAAFLVTMKVTGNDTDRHAVTATIPAEICSCKCNQ